MERTSRKILCVCPSRRSLSQGVSKMQTPSQFPDGRPKQKRHRCRNPNKIDVNSLTGEERVQIINRRNARKVGAPRGTKYTMEWNIELNINQCCLKGMFGRGGAVVQYNSI